VDGTAPDATHGFVLPKDAQPGLIQVGRGSSIKVASTIAGNSIVNALWLR
jgi:hypothetical protein